MTIIKKMLEAETNVMKSNDETPKQMIVSRYIREEAARRAG